MLDRDEVGVAHKLHQADPKAAYWQEAMEPTLLSMQDRALPPNRGIQDAG